MAQIREFKGLRPRKDLVEKVAELPYDVVSTQEARELARGNDLSFFRISRAEIEFDENADPYGPAVYRKGRENLESFIARGVFSQDPEPCLYLYTHIMVGRSQTGLVACVNIDDYLRNTIKKHELTRADKEQDRTTHLDVLEANTGPVFLLYREKKEIGALFARALTIEPEYHFVAPDGVSHILRVIHDQSMIREFKGALKNVDLYIADGHHRAASAVRVGQMRREANPSYTGDEEFNWFLSVIFPHDQLNILPYNRVVRDLNGHSVDAFMKKIGDLFTITPAATGRTEKNQTFRLYLTVNGAYAPRFDIPMTQ
jgi:uncharacterized protein (DUF1015 family)